jgi:hypothetical protein
MPEWYLAIALLGLLSLLSFLWPPLSLSWPVFLAAAGMPLVQAGSFAAHVTFAHAPHSGGARFKLRLLTAWLHLLQPLARLCGRLRHGLTIWRQPAVVGLALPRPWLANIWSKRSLSVDERLQSIETALRAYGALPLRGGDFDAWDLEVRGGPLGSARMFAALEYHGDGRQLLRIRSWPRCSVAAVVLTLTFAALAIGAAHDQAWNACFALGVVSVLAAARTINECGAATAAFLAATRKLEWEEKSDER